MAEYFIVVSIATVDRIVEALDSRSKKTNGRMAKIYKFGSAFEMVDKDEIYASPYTVATKSRDQLVTVYVRISMTSSTSYLCMCRVYLLKATLVVSPFDYIEVKFEVFFIKTAINCFVKIRQVAWSFRSVLLGAPA
ncbi:hypothetical protein MAM1_0519c10820 [Mucor ambiguus]|uniref:Uncharacterized protein n=1 Tax=Mucor ambiguus TaxID=91626 RepID=A0A0C9MKH5_9FUNG|nr:hypothetical protein MAM1_0519c10820 [Mucor ambiguus]